MKLEPQPFKKHGVCSVSSQIDVVSKEGLFSASHLCQTECANLVNTLWNLDHITMMD